jgi:excisionase family DNA binding protein
MRRSTITVPEISERLGICEETVYEMLRDQAIPNIRYGRRFIISRAAYERWEATIGEAIQPSLANQPKPNDADTTSARSTRSPKAA